MWLENERKVFEIRSLLGTSVTIDHTLAYRLFQSPDGERKYHDSADSGLCFPI